MREHPGLLEWLASGERGISSNAIVTHLTGLDAMYGGFRTSTDHPHDPDDMTRCIRLLESVPTLCVYFHRMAEVSDVWARLVEHWDEICASLDSELPNWRKREYGDAAKTYRMMRAIIDGVPHA